MSNNDVRRRARPARRRASVQGLLVVLTVVVVAACGGSGKDPAAVDEAKTYAGVGDETARTTFLQRTPLPSCGTIEITTSTWTAAGDDLTKRDCFFRAVDNREQAELHLVSRRADAPDDATRVEEWVRTFADGTGEVFTLFPPAVSAARWKRAACTGWSLGSGPLNATKEYPGCKA